MSSAKGKSESSGFFASLVGMMSGKDAVLAEKARLEAFLAAVPGEYCGWAADGSLAYSGGFCELLGLERIENINDILRCLCAEDSAALEGGFYTLCDSGKSFSLYVHDREKKKILRVNGVRGQDIAGADAFHILWLEDMSDLHREKEDILAQQKAEKSEFEYYQDTLDALAYPVWIRDEHQKIIWVNVAYARRVDVKPSDILAQQIEIVSSSRTRKPSEKDVVLGADLARLAIEKGLAQSVEAHAVFSGKRFLLRVWEQPVKARKITVGFAEDLTSGEDLAREMSNHLSANRALLEQLHSAIGIYGVDYRLEFYNSAFAELWGLEEGWLNTKPKLGELMEKLRETRRLPEQADFRKYKQSWLDMFTSLIDPYEDMLHLPDGSALRMLVVPHKIGGLMMTFEDVTSRLALESSYNTLIAVQKETLDNLAEGVAVYGGNGRLRLWNPAFGRLWALDPESLDGEPHISRVVDRLKKFFNEQQWSVMRENLMTMGLERFMNAGRLERVDKSLLNYTTVPLPDGGVLTTFTDITDSVQIEKMLREKNAALEAAEQLKLDFLANVSYQLRTPLSAIMGFNEMLDREYFGALNNKQKEYTRDIQDASQKLLNLINDILDLSSIEAGYMDLEIKDTSIKSMMESIDGLVRDWARKEKIEIELSCPANIGKAQIDESRIKQAVVNLVRNAIAHTPAGGRIAIASKRKKDGMEIIISDTGQGIPQDALDRVMQPFERIEGAAQSGRGAGLGLTLVQNIVTLHGGEFTLESQEGKGTIATMFLPLKFVQQNQDDLLMQIA